MRILYIDIDALRPDHLGCYGYHRATSPVIDALARRGLRFTQYYASDAPCLPSRTALYTGRWGIHTGVVGHGGTAADPIVEGPGRGFRDCLQHTCFPGRLQRAGFYTAQISPFGQRHAARHFYAGFHEIHDTGLGGMESAEMVTPVVERWLRGNAARDQWFLHVNYWDPHTPYRTPDGFDPFAGDPLPAWLTEEMLRKHQDHPGPHGALQISMYDDLTNPKYPRHPGAVRTMEDMRRLIDGYDSGIKYVDDQVGRILELLEEAGVADETAIIISSDHGENFGELGIYAEHGTADAITCRVPLIVVWPQGKSGEVRNGLHYNVDLAPTLLDLLGQRDLAPGNWDGESFADAVRGPDDPGRPYLVVSQCAHVCQRSVRFDDWIYIRTYHDGYHLFPREMLFNLQADPHELHDVAPSRPDVCRQAAALLLDWHQDAMLRSPHAVDPLWTVMREGGPFHARGQLRRYLDFLERTGRGHHVPELRRRHPAEVA